VRKNEILASFYAPEFVNAQQSYFTALETTGRTTSQQLPSVNLQRVFEGLERYADQLRNLGVSETQLAEMARKRELVQDIHVLSPIDGFVLQRNVSSGLRFDRGFEMYRIADLRRVWILADVYQHQMPFICAGTAVRLTTPQVDRAFSGVVSHSEPIFDQESLTMQVRIEADNPQSVLKPGMFTDVEFTIDVRDALVVPADAISDSGLRKTVFVDLGDGYFEPRQVNTGWRIGDQVEVTRGLMPGERIVISGTFLVDSESRMKAAAQGIFGKAAEDPVCGMQVDERRAAAAGRVVERGGKTYYFCADTCRHSFERSPDQYLKRAAPPTTGAPTPAATAKDPICGMTVNQADARKAGLVAEHDGRTYYFCSAQCMKDFDAAARKR
jgi:Cu(I)/Ag(I) efflux system membrane fusion protein